MYLVYAERHACFPPVSMTSFEDEDEMAMVH